MKSYNRDSWIKRVVMLRIINRNKDKSLNDKLDDDPKIITKIKLSGVF